MPPESANGPGPDPVVLVVGAGPVGLTLACELLRHGVPCRVVDADEGPTPTNESRALAIQARTLEVFDAMGIAPALLDRGLRVSGANLDAGGRRIASIRIGPDVLDTPYPFILALPQGETERVLLGRLGELGGSVDWRTRVESLRQDGRGVSATLIDAEGKPLAVRSAWLVGADGAHSVVRHQLGLTFEGAAYPEEFLVADARIDWDRPHDQAQVFLTPAGAIAAIPLPEPGTWRLIDTTGLVVTDETGPALDHLRGLIHAQAGPDAEVADPTWISAFRIHRRIVDRFRVGRCFVAGDAAHLHSPAGGQGMNTGIQDAQNLAWKFGLVHAGIAPETLLDSYEAERRPVAIGVLKGTDRATRAITLRNAIARSVRDRLASILLKLGPVRRRLARGVAEIDVDYRSSPIVAEIGPNRSRPRAGDRVPDLALFPTADGPDRLFDLLRGPRHTLFLFGDESDGREVDAALVADGERARARLGDRVAIHRVVRSGVDRSALGGDVPTRLDPDGRLRRHFGIGPASVVLVRPDGYVGFRAPAIDPDAFDRTLTRVLG